MNASIGSYSSPAEGGLHTLWNRIFSVSAFALPLQRSPLLHVPPARSWREVNTFLSTPLEATPPRLPSLFFRPSGFAPPCAATLKDLTFLGGACNRRAGDVPQAPPSVNHPVLLLLGSSANMLSSRGLGV